MAQTKGYGWILEVCEFIQEIDSDGNFIHNRWGDLHIGYMNKVFDTKQDAVDYYDRHNPHMRSINAHGDYHSDWDPNTRLLYNVRQLKSCEIRTITPFHVQ